MYLMQTEQPLFYDLLLNNKSLTLNCIFFFFNNFTFGQCVNLRPERYLLLFTLDRYECTMVKSNKNCNVPLQTFSS